MRKHMNVAQQQIFLRFMKDHPDLARGFVKGDKVTHDELWNILKNKLNFAGAPIKETSCWKKSWIDWKANVKRKVDHIKKNAQKNNNISGEQMIDEGILNQCVLTKNEEQIAHICELYKTVDRIDNTKSFGINKKSIQTTFSTTSQPASSPFQTNTSASRSPQPTASNQRERNRIDLKETEIAPKRKRCEKIEDILNENNNLETINAKIDLLVKNKKVEQTILEKIVNTLNNIDTRLGNLEKKYDKIVEIEIKKLAIISQHNVLLEKSDDRMEKPDTPNLEAQLATCLSNDIESENATNHPEEHYLESLQNIVEEISLDIKEEFYSDSDSLKDFEINNQIDVCNTEYIYLQDIVKSVESLDEMKSVHL